MNTATKILDNGPNNKFEQIMSLLNYIGLKLDLMHLENRLWHEYPNEMSESRKRLCRRWLEEGFVKCKHE